VIRHWSINNFKSISEAKLPLAPLTMFAGANSSGKSTLLQSILLIAQTLAGRSTTQTVALNGHFTKLGQFDDLRNSVTGENRIRICWTITPVANEDRAMLRLRRVQSMIEQISCEVTFGISENSLRSEQLNPTLFEFDLSSIVRSPDDKPNLESKIHLARKDLARPPGQEQPSQRIRNRFTSDYRIDLDSESSEDLRDDYADGKPVACAIQTFLPITLIVDFDEKVEIVRAILSGLAGNSRHRSSRALANATPKVPGRLLSELCNRVPVIKDALMPLLPFESDDEVGLQEFLDGLRRIRIRTAMTPDVLATIESIAMDVLPPSRGVNVTLLPGRSLEDAVDYTREFFARQVKYLGPLREEPKALYPLQNTADPQDVGLHGEHTAAVLHRYRYTEVQYIPSSSFEDSGTNATTKEATLEDAVFDWLNYLDVAKKVETSDEGKFGYGLKVTMSGGSIPHDLTHVGVGVSQVLPIVVMCLLSSRDTTIVIEQPELHLNPKVQTRLADFFLSMAMLQKQCLIETHSEYLINRLRLRAALADGTAVSDLLRLYFVEQAGGLTTYRDVQINEYGTILKWPKGFFDQSQREVEEILLAAGRKGT
jgi:predicted ATPase